MMSPIPAGLAIATVLFAAAPAAAFWERSPLMKCVEAQTEIERQRRRCWIDDPVVDAPVVVLPVPSGRGLMHRRGGWSYDEVPMPQDDLVPRAPVVRRLG